MEEDTIDKVELDTEELLNFFNSIVVDNPDSFVKFKFPSKIDAKWINRNDRRQNLINIALAYFDYHHGLNHSVKGFEKYVEDILKNKWKPNSKRQF